MTTKQTKGQEAAADVAALLRARNTLIWIVTREEARVERYLVEAAASASYVPRTWDVGQGIADMTGARDKTVTPDADAQAGSRDPSTTLGIIRDRSLATDENGRPNRVAAERGMWIMRDLPAWIAGPGTATTARQVRNLARSLSGVERERAQAMIVLTPSADVPPELAGHATVMEWPLPDRDEIADILDTLTEQYSLDLNGQREAAIDSAVGLTHDEASACYSKSLVQLKTIDPAVVSKEKKRVIARERVLEWIDPIPGGLAAVGGLENLKRWLVSRSNAYTPEARAYGLRSPKGCLLVGIPGCGKSLIAKAIAAAWGGLPLLKLDMGALKSKFVGESEQNLRKAFAVIAAIGRCVVWLDEIEKALAGATDGSADGGVSSDALGAILTWMQERQGDAFVIATSNDVSKLPPELLRKGRFDELFYVDLPNEVERLQVLAASMRTHGRSFEKIDTAESFARVAKATKDFTGSEIAELVPSAMFAAFADGREITVQDLLNAAGETVPLATTSKDKIEALRKWGAERARPATAPLASEATAAKAKKPARALDLD